MPFPATKCAAAALLMLSTGAAGDTTLLSDDFNRPNSIIVGNGWIETETGAAHVQILANEFDFNASGQSNLPIAQHAIPEQTGGTLRFMFEFDWVRTGNDNAYEVWMQLGDAGAMTASDDTAGVAVNLKWAGPGDGMTNHEGFGYVTGGGATTTEVAVVSGSHTIEVLADLDAKTYEIAIDSVTVATGIPFDNDAPINALRLRIDGVNQGLFGQMAFDDMLVQQVHPTLVLADHPAGQQTDALSESGGETGAELLAFSLDPGPDTIAASQMAFTLSQVNGLSDGDWSGVEIIVDVDGDGDVDPGETTTVGGAGVVDTTAGTITFATPFAISSAANYILRADFPSLSDGDEVTVGLNAAGVTSAEDVTGSTTPVTHLERCHVSLYEEWTTASPNTWQTMDLSAAPYSVPPNAVVEVAVVTTSAATEQWVGFRQTGSSADRRFRLHEAEDGGSDVLTLHVVADASSSIEYYASTPGLNIFVLLGYWTCGTYVEANDTFSAGASGSWREVGLAGSGVGSGDVAEIVIANWSVTSRRLGGVRANGSKLNRRIGLHEAEGGGVDVVAMHVAADATASAAIEVYAESDADVSFTLVGYWSLPPRPYAELFVSFEGPTADGTWEDKDLGTHGVPAGAVAEIILANDEDTSESEMGVRPNGSTANRLLDLHEAESVGVDAARVQVATDDAALIEFRHADVSASHRFYLVGYWGAPVAGDLMLVVGDAASPAGADLMRRATFEAWGWTATFVDDGAPVATIDAAVVANDVVYVSSTVDAGTLGTKLNDVPGGVVSEAGDGFDDLGVTTAATGTRTGSDLDVLPVNHYITASLTGQVSICVSPQPLNDIPVSLARGARALAQPPGGSTYALVAVDWCGTDTGRRVLLPWGGAGFDFTSMNSSGLEIVQRSLDWGRALKAHWKLDETAGTVATDAGPGGFDATLVNMAGTEWTNGGVEGGLALDGFDDYLVAATAPRPTGAFSISLWFKPDAELALLDTRQDLLYGVTGARPHVTFNRDGTGAVGLHVRVDGVDYDDVVTTTSTWSAGWHHVVFTWDGTEFNVYVAGNLENGLIVHAGTHADSTGVYLGRSAIGDHFEGAIDDVRIYDLALTDDEVAALYNACHAARIVSWQEMDPLP